MASTCPSGRQTMRPLLISSIGSMLNKTWRVTSERKCSW